MSAQGSESAGELRRAGESVERLLGEVRQMVGPPAFRKVEELIERIVGLYGAGLDRMMALLVEREADWGTLRERLAADELLASLLLLHGLHPVEVGERVHRAVERVARALGGTTGTVEILATEGTKVRLRFGGDWSDAPASRPAVEAALKRAVADVAPDVTELEIEPGTFFATDPALVQIKRRAPPTQESSR